MLLYVLVVEVLVVLLVEEVEPEVKYISTVNNYFKSVFLLVDVELVVDVVPM